MFSWTCEGPAIDEDLPTNEPNEEDGEPEWALFGAKEPSPRPKTNKNQDVFPVEIVPF